ncbi:UDP-N-acetylenolpyruvoylglucosamine reductase [Candidatus Daviesbacteria bacterium RIFCSPLOWO2_02_FULL_41_8]|uniref:UDP-N-acetylenolpyruvoylglucosamine reductase n=3 Tax=Candidatus Daviesiibacteriota TaxID=1752718 RepID=A0A1F5NL31_9BACT|nr:MAG: UDP-N-acetylenolpyruvoylglucosamine reductase [Candidatus Daviesbacteria bacterium RIFCSPHIGHO2_01_FULL_41_23]OGE33864.1 MAG: UDP-N-acetylenolpyruvoylglucosamine reductase [Candidatus Daviesbacteria bacterium RIFCSPHIGHO2_02_FULL_41_10]OGE62305.1 MAG: UDP-N-acetylenolpyruvoylglucosamine reductase [Candidatus Daviesbacteria bacterium RIFCSPLOWO2_01_FULL_41_32]OGE78401.1 MAG: UDP-N-acetylenolpyruvoylglucosamine reductase [Candidatus Daviesbacteria bacterium RIFCSPLOWO2_02_FULL_41_8]
MQKLEDNFPMSKVTTLQIGGPAKKFTVVTTQEELIEAIQYAKAQQIPYLVIGGGSNLLVADEGVDFLIIKNETSGIHRHLPGEQRRHLEGAVALSVQSGTPLQELVDYAINHGLSGLQKLSGIPGTVGGAVYGNAGAYGQTISDHIISVVALNPSSVIPAKAGIYTNNLYGSRIKYGMTKQDCQFSYRDSIFKKTHDTILEITFRLEPGDPKTLSEEAQEVLSKRLIKYPPGIKCPGSFFKNLVASEIPEEILKNIPPEKIVYGKLPAGALLEEVGAKGQSLDGIKIADYHANLFINQGTGTAKAFYDLAKTYVEKVKTKFGIILEPEVQLINLPPLI